jgi:hypothetical protein
MKLEIKVEGALIARRDKFVMDKNQCPNQKA